MLPYQIDCVYWLDNISLYRLSEYWIKVISVHLYCACIAAPMHSSGKTMTVHAIFPSTVINTEHHTVYYNSNLQDH